MAITVTINAVDRTSKTLLNQMSIDMTLGSDWTATIPVRDKDDSTASAYRPALDQSVTIADGGTTLFHGTVTRVEDKPIAPPHIGTLTVITARAKSQVVDQILVNQSAPAGFTLEDWIDNFIANYLTAYGITKDATMATGATLEAQSFVDVTMRAALNHLADITGWVWRITPSDELQFFSVGTKAAGYSLTAANKLSIGPITWEKSRQQYYNSVNVRYGTEGNVNKTWTATGNGVTTTWFLDYDAAGRDQGYILSAGYVTDDGVFSPLSPYPSGGTTWMYDATDNSLHRTAALPNTKVATFVYAAKFPQLVSVQDSGEVASNGRFSGLFEAPDIFDLAAASELALGLLRKGTAVPQWVRLSTRQGFVMPGDQITLTFADRTVGGNHLITQVHITTIAKGTPVYALTCLSGTELQQTWADQLKAALGGGGSNAPGGTISGSVVPNFSGHFDSEVSAFTGLDLSGDGFESKLTTYINSAGEGPALQLGRDDAAYRWVMTADSDHGASAGTVAKLRFHIPRRGSSIEAGMMLVEDNANTDKFVVLPGANAILYLGDYASNITGLSSPDNRVEGILTQEIMARAGYFERSRTTRMGEWINVAFSAGNFAASSGSWTLTSGDQATFAYTLSGKTMTVAFSLDTTTVSATPGALFISIPGGFSAARRMGNPIALVDGGAVGTGIWRVEAADAKIYLYKDLGSTPWAASTNTTYVEGVAEFEVQ